MLHLRQRSKLMVKTDEIGKRLNDLGKGKTVKEEIVQAAKDFKNRELTPGRCAMAASCRNRTGDERRRKNCASK